MTVGVAAQGGMDGVLGTGNENCCKSAWGVNSGTESDGERRRGKGKKEGQGKEGGRRTYRRQNTTGTKGCGGIQEEGRWGN